MCESINLVNGEWSVASWFLFTHHSRLISFNKFQRGGINAVAQAGWVRAIIEYMTEVCAATAAMNFGTHHVVRTVGGSAYIFCNQWLVKARPTGAAFKLVQTAEDRLPATNTLINALLMIVPV